MILEIPGVVQDFQHESTVSLMTAVVCFGPEEVKGLLHGE